MVPRRSLWKYSLITILALSLVAVPFFFEYLRYTGYTVVNPYLGVTESIQNQEPDGAKPDYQAYNTIEYDEVGGKYNFKYSGDSYSITYSIDPDDTSTTKTALLRAVTANVNYAGSSFSFNPAMGGIRVNVGGTTVDPWSSSSSLTRKTNSKKIEGNTLKVSYNFTLNGQSTTVNVTYKIKGKTLIVDLQSSERYIDRIGPEYTSGGSPTESINPEMSFASTWKYSIKKGNVFVTAYSDATLSGASFISSYSPSLLSGGRTFWNHYTYYNPNTEGARQPVKERFYITVSDNWNEIFPNIPNPPSPYRSYMKDKTVLDVWDVYYYCTDITSYVAKLHAYGMKDLLVNLLGYCNQWETKLLPNLTYYGDDFTKYAVYVDCYQNDASCYKPDWIAQSQDGSLINSFYNPITNQQSYALRTNRQREIAQIKETEKKNKGIKAAFIDVIANGPPWAYIDYGTVIPGANGSFSFQRDQYIQLLQQVKSIYGGPVLSEGGAGAQWAGYADSWEASQTCCSNDYKSPVIVDYQLRKIKPLAVAYPSYIRRFVPNGNNDANYKGITESNIDQYLTTGIAFGHIGFIDSPFSNLHNIPDTTVIRMYYMTKELQKQYALEQAEKIEYFVNGQWVSVSDAARAGYNFVNAQVRVTYENGLVVYVNRHSSASLSATHDGKTYTIPSNGYLAYNPRDNFFEFSGLTNGARTDISENSQYVFIDPRGTKINFTLQDNNYYSAERFNLGKAKQPVNFTFTILDKTIIAASEPLLLTRLAQTGSNVRVTMNSATKTPISVEQLSGTPPPVCNIATFCQNGNIYKNNTDCSQTLIQVCQYGCTSAACNPAPIPPPESDVTPPVLSAAGPAGILPSGTSTATLTISSNENASCKYAKSPGIIYDSMNVFFNSTGETQHSAQLQGLENGSYYSHYVRCIDQAGNFNTNDYAITFSIASPPELPPLNETINKSIEYPSNIYLEIDGANYSGQLLNGTKDVRIYLAQKPVVEFPYSFDGLPSQLNLDLSNVETGIDNGIAGYTLIKNLPVTQKKLFVEKVADVTALCVKDAALNSIDEISENCDQLGEQILVCPNQGQPAIAGLTARYYSFGSNAISSIPEFASLTPSLVLSTSQINFAPVTTAFYGTPYVDHFAAKYSGFIDIPSSGTYIFYLSSDDGSRLKIDGSNLINNDLVHAMKEITGSATLSQGLHPIEVEFFENLGSAGLILQWKQPGGSKQIVPATVLKQNAQTGSSLTCTINSNMFEISPLSHSGVKQYVCTQSWSCSEWSACSGGTQTRSCTCSCFGGVGCSGDSTSQQSCEETAPPASSGGSSGGGGGGGSGGGGFFEPPVINTTTTESPQPVTEPKETPPVQEQPKQIIEQIREPDGNIASVIDITGEKTVTKIRKSYTTSWIILGLTILAIFSAYQFAQHNSLKPAMLFAEKRTEKRGMQVSKELRDYVKLCRDHGLTDKKIRAKLESAGWDDDQVRRGLR